MLMMEHLLVYCVVLSQTQQEISELYDLIMDITSQKQVIMLVGNMLFN